MSDDGIEIRMRAWALDCWVCHRMARHGALHLVGEALLSLGRRHLIGARGRALCEGTA